MRESTRVRYYAKTMEEYQFKLKRRISKYTSITEDQEDVYQEVSAGFWKALPDLRRGVNPGTLLYAVAQHKIMDFLRKKYKKDYETAWKEIPFLVPIQNAAKIEEELDAKINPLHVLIRLTDGDTKDLLIAIKKTKERLENDIIGGIEKEMERPCVPDEGGGGATELLDPQAEKRGKKEDAWQRFKRRNQGQDLKVKREVS